MTMSIPSPNGATAAGSPSGTDTIFRADSRPSDFAFDAGVSAVFDDMVSRSVPFYTELQRMLVDLAVEFLPEENGVVCDLGCSTGTTLALLAAHPRSPASTRFIGVDNAPDMLDRARTKLASGIAAGRVELIEADLAAGMHLPRCHVVLMNWTLQFVRPLHRESVLRWVADRIESPGALLLSEKVLVADSLLNRTYIELYLQYKRRNGYTDREIQRKREALENVLVPYRVEENTQMLQRCGFGTVDSFFRWFNFASFVAIKGT